MGSLFSTFPLNSCFCWKNSALFYIFVRYTLEPSCCKKWQKSPNQETGLGNRGRLKVLNDTKFVLNKHEEFPYSFRINLVSFKTFRPPIYSTNQFLGWNFFWCFLQQDRSTHVHVHFIIYYHDVLQVCTAKKSEI